MLKTAVDLNAYKPLIERLLLSEQLVRVSGSVLISSFVTLTLQYD